MAYISLSVAPCIDTQHQSYWKASYVPPNKHKWDELVELVPDLLLWRLLLLRTITVADYVLLACQCPVGIQ